MGADVIGANLVQGKVADGVRPTIQVPLLGDQCGRFLPRGLELWQVGLS